MSSKSKKASSRGTRYTDKQKAEIVAFVNKVNSEKGRGGQSAASKKFKISPITISSWLKKSGAPKTAGKKRGRPAAASKTSSTASFGKKLAKLQSLNKQIERAEADLAKMKAEFEALKASL
ncbi:MAG: hypothetical protein ACPG4K_01500 [Haloferula sp.]